MAVAFVTIGDGVMSMEKEMEVDDPRPQPSVGGWTRGWTLQPASFTSPTSSGTMRGAPFCPPPPSVHPDHTSSQSSSPIGDQTKPRASTCNLGRNIEQYRNRVELHRGRISTVYQAVDPTTGTPVVIKISTVYQAVDLSTGTPVVIKCYHKEKMTSKHFEKLQREGSRAAALTLQVITPLLYVLMRCHAMNIIHRDVKPENIFLSRHGTLKLGDFGLAIDHTKELAFNRAGTLDYMAPEVLKNPHCDLHECPSISMPLLESRGVKPYNTKVDIWAVGVLAYELVCGKTPFEVEDEKQTASHIMHSNNICLPESVTDQMKDFVQQALQKDPMMRPDAGALLAHPWIQENTKKVFGRADLSYSVIRSLAPSFLLESSTQLPAQLPAQLPGPSQVPYANPPPSLVKAIQVECNTQDPQTSILALPTQVYHKHNTPSPAIGLSRLNPTQQSPQQSSRVSSQFNGFAKLKGSPQADNLASRHGLQGSKRLCSASRSAPMPGSTLDNLLHLQVGLDRTVSSNLGDEMRHAVACAQAHIQALEAAAVAVAVAAERMSCREVQASPVHADMHPTSFDHERAESQHSQAEEAHGCYNHMGVYSQDEEAHGCYNHMGVYSQDEEAHGCYNHMGVYSQDEEAHGCSNHMGGGERPGKHKQHAMLDPGQGYVA
eukprot:gene14082-20033_t